LTLLVRFSKLVINDVEWTTTRTKPTRGQSTC